MKKLLCLILLLLAVSVSAVAVAAPTVSNEVVQAMLESSLKNGFSPQKDLQAMLDNAFLNGYDHFEVTYHEKNHFFKVDVAIKGFASALENWQESDSEGAADVLSQTKQSIITHWESIQDLFRIVGREDIRYSFTILDDDSFFKYGFSTSDIVQIFTMNNGERVIWAKVDSWKEAPKKEAQ